jgi:hypothetical protein
MKISDNRMIAWGTVAGAVLTALITAGTVIAYEVHTADGVWHCRQAVERHEQRLDAIASDVAKTREDVGYLRGRCGPPKDQVTAK